jgi:N-acetylglucosamine-6-phosphate deacetylase
MTILRLHSQHLFDGQNFSHDQVLTIEQGKIIAIDQDTATADQYVTGLLAPGYIDLQVNGGGGVLLNNSPSVAGIRTMSQAHAKFGTTAMLPTLITDTLAVMARAADAIAAAIAEQVPGIIGVHFEGPHLSVAKKGAHSEAYIRPISDLEWQILSRKDLGQVLVTLAPETVSVSDVARMVELGIKVCLGHSNADHKTAQAALDAGADGFTHLFNAMSPLQGREPGLVGTALLNDQASCGIILDGHHVDFNSCALAIKTKPRGKVFLVTDAMPPVATQQTEFDFFKRKVTLADGKLTSSTGELAGSVLDMATAVRNAHIGLQLPLDEAIRMATLYPFEYLSRNNQVPGIRGQLIVGAQADMVQLDKHQVVQSTWIAGQQVFSHTADL